MATTVLGLKTFAASDPVDYNEVNDNYVKIDNGVKTAMQGRAAHNWLDNSWFVNPVNQRGKTSYTASSYCIDRWMLDMGSASITSSGIKLTGAVFRQAVALKAGTYTFAIHLSTDTTLFIRFQYDGSSSVTSLDGESATTGAYITMYNYNSGVVMVQFVQSNDSSVVHTAVWAALYEGSYTADTLPAYQPKGYAAELAECQLYYLPLNHQLLGSGYTFNGGAALLVPRKMRIDAPSFVASGTIIARVNGADYPLTLSSVTTYGSMIKVDFASNTIPVNYPCAFYSDAPGVSLNADL